MFQMRGRRGLISQTSRAVTLLAAFGCLEPMEPTPDSAPVVITPRMESILVTKLASGWTFTLQLRVRNYGTRTVFVDLSYRVTEKLIDQKWKIAAFSPETRQLREIPPSQTQTISYAVTYVHGTVLPGTQAGILEHARGLYRVGLRLFYSSNGSDPLPAENYYSRSFVVLTE